MTIPTLISKYQKMVFVTKAKQIYSILSNALVTSVAENGPMSDWVYGSDKEKYSTDTENDLTYIVNTYFKPYFKVAEDIGYDKDIGNRYSLLLNNGMTLTFSLDGSTNPITKKYQYHAIWILVSNNRNATYFTDKSHDYSRHDMMFAVVKPTISKNYNNAVYPFAYFDSDNSASASYSYTKIKSRDELINGKKYGCNKNIDKNKRVNCTALMMWDGWQIKDDYPW